MMALASIVQNALEGTKAAQTCSLSYIMSPISVVSGG